MPVTGTARISALPQNFVSAVSTHLQTHHNAQPAGPWRIQYRPYQLMRSHSASGQRGRRTMWQVSDAAYPNQVFVVFEDTSKPTRADTQAAEVTETSSTEGLHRWHAHVLSAEFPTMLRQSTLPGPLGSPAGTPGPGAWVQRGAHILLDGLSFRVQVGPRTQMRRNAMDSVGEQECILSIGTVVIGSDRIVGGMVEIQYLPVSRLPPDSTLLGSLLATLLPPDIVPLLVPPKAQFPLPISTMAIPTMIPEAQLAEIVPCCSSIKPVPVPGAPGFGPWDDGDGHVDTTLDPIGWTGVEVRRRMAYVHLTMLRAEGLA